MRFTARATAVLLGALLPTVGVAVAAHAQDLPSDTTTLSRLVVLNPGMTEEAMLEALTAEAKSSGVSITALAAKVLVEAESSASSASAVQGGSSKGRAVQLSSSSGGGSSTTSALGSSKYRGDVFYSPSSTLFINHGNSGIFYTTSTIVHAPGGGSVSRSDSASKMRVGSGAQKQSVTAGQTERNSAANYAYTKLRDRPYNSNFALNRKNSNAINCSQLVWLAYRETSNRDLDGNGGAGVYPSNIRDSKYTSTYKYL